MAHHDHRPARLGPSVLTNGIWYKLAGLIDFEMFRPELDLALARSDGSKGGRPPLDAVMMFKRLPRA